jgi:hypothetical protein
VPSGSLPAAWIRHRRCEGGLRVAPARRRWPHAATPSRFRRPGSTGYGERYQGLGDTTRRLDSSRDLVAVHGWLTHGWLTHGRLTHAGLDPGRVAL